MRPSRLLLFRALGLVGCVALLAEFASSSREPLLFVALLSLGALVAAGRRVLRFPSAVVLAVVALTSAIAVPTDRQLGPGLAVAGACFALACVALLWPRTAEPAEAVRLPELPGSWVLLSTLLVALADGYSARFLTGVRNDPAVLVNGLALLTFFAFVAWGSRMGRLRWVGQGIAVALLAGLEWALDVPFAFRSSALGSDSSQVIAASLALGAGGVALAMDWLRSPLSGRARFARAFLVSLGTQAIEPLAVAPGQVRWEAWLGIAAARAAAFGLALGLAPRIAGKARTWWRFGRRPAGARLRMAALTGLTGVAIAAEFAALAGHRDLPVVGAVGALATTACALFTLVRRRFARAVLFTAGVLFSWLLSAAAGVVGSGSGSRVGDLLAPLALLTVGSVAYVVSHPRASRHFPRGSRGAFVPHPLVSGALGLAAVSCAAVFLLARIDPAAQSAFAGRFLGLTPLATPLPLSYPEPHVPARTVDLRGATVFVDPVGRGVWTVASEDDAVMLTSPDGKVRKFAVGAWPQQVVVDWRGTAYVSCRGAGWIERLPFDGEPRRIPVGAEPRGLALDELDHRLYVGLVTEKAVVSVDTETLEVVARAELPAPPRELAMTAEGLAVLPQLGGSVWFASADLRTVREVPLSAGSRKAWHGQALIPMGRDLVVIHAAVDTGLSNPVPTGGYGGAVAGPVVLVASVLRDGQPTFYPEQQLSSRELPAFDVVGAAISGDRLVLASQGDQSVVELSVPGFSKQQQSSSHPGLVGVAVDEGGARFILGDFGRTLVVEGSCGPWSRHRRVMLLTPREDPEIALGRSLFHDATDRAISAHGLACATCHPDGREDGLVWRLQGMRLQTPMLAGRLADTAPYNWHATSQTLEENIGQTTNRLEGTGLDGTKRKALAAYLLRGLHPVSLPAREDPALVAEGKRLFQSSEVGCATCHAPESAFTDGLVWDVDTVSPRERKELAQVRGAHTLANPRGTPEMDPARAKLLGTPSLRYLALTPPYLHDGSEPTLEALLTHNRDRMGHTSQLDPRERRALIAYLRTL